MPNRKMHLIEVCQVNLPKVLAFVDSLLNFNLEDLHAVMSQASDARNFGHGPIAFTNEPARQACVMQLLIPYAQGNPMGTTSC